MRLWQDGLIAMLAAIGLTTLIWLAVSLVLRLRRPIPRRCLALVPAREGAAGLEHTVRTLEQLRSERGAFGSILIVDCGLSPVGRQVAALLAREDRDISLCTRENVERYLDG